MLQSIVRLADPELFAFSVYSSLDGVLRPQVEAAGATVRIIPRTLPKLDPVWIGQLARAFKTDRIQLIHAHLFGDSLHGLLAARLTSRVPVVLTLHTVASALPRLQRLGYRSLLPLCDRAVACSKTVLDSFNTEFPSLAEETLLVRNGVDIELFDADQGGRVGASKERSLGIPADDTVFATIGRLSEEKHQDTILEAFSQLPEITRCRSRLILIGDGPMRDQLVQQASESGLGDRVVFAGNRTDISQLLSAIDVIVAASEVEGLSIAILEAMTASKCIVASDIPGVREAVRHNREAILFNPESVEQLTASLQGVFADPGMRETLGKQARIRAEEGFSARAMVQSYSEIYREVRL